MVQRIIQVILITGLLYSWSWAGKPVYVATVQPLAAILREITGDNNQVACLLSPGASPHTYEPTPSDLKITNSAQIFFYVAPALDAWAAKLPAQKKVSVLSLLPTSALLKNLDQDEGGDYDPHFWTDPLLVKELLPKLVHEMGQTNPAKMKLYQTNAGNFARRLDLLDKELQLTLAPIKGHPIFLFHPSLLYLMKRYGLVLGGLIEPFPGKEPSPALLKQLVKKIRSSKAKAIFSEPQLSRKPADVLAEAAKVKVFTLDPNGGIPGRMTYEELIRYNAHTLLTALQ